MRLRRTVALLRAGFIAAALFVASRMVPVGGALAMIFAPLPIMDYALGREDWLFRSFGAVAIAGALTGLAIGWAGGAAYLVTFGLGTIVICQMLENRRPFEMVVLGASAAMLIAGTFASFAAAGSPAALAEALRHALATGMARGEEFYRMLGVESPLNAETRAAVLDITMRLSPALVALSAACAVLIDLMIFWRWFDHGRLGYRLFADLARWSAPEWLIWVLLATGFALFVPVAAIATIALDGFVIVATIYFCQGLAIMAFYFKMLSMPGLARGLIYFVTAIQPVLAALVCAAGVFDMWVDFRRLKPQSPEAGSFGDFL